VTSHQRWIRCRSTVTPVKERRRGDTAQGVFRHPLSTMMIFISPPHSLIDTRALRDLPKPYEHRCVFTGKVILGGQGESGFVQARLRSYSGGGGHEGARDTAEKAEAPSRSLE
jgi:hypothetical protein